MSDELTKKVAAAIRRADTSLFFEDYTKQATAVLQALAKDGYALMPLNATPAMVEHGVNAIPYGSNKPEQIVATVYAAMAQSARGRTSS